MKNLIERPLVFVSIAYAFGIVAGTFLIESILTIYLLISAAVLFLITLWVKKSVRIFLAISFILTALFGAFAYQFNRHISPDDISNPGFHGRGSLEGNVISEVDEKEKGRKKIVSFTLEAQSWWKKELKARVKGNVRVTLLNTDTIPRLGDVVRLKGNLDFPKSAMNPGEFDFRGYLEKQNIRASFMGFGKKAIRILNPHPTISLKKGEELWVRVIRKIFELRRAIHDRAYLLAPFPEREILLSLITGERTNIPREITDDFVRTGTVHVLAISGFQVSLVAGVTFLILRWLGFSFRAAALVSGIVLMLYVPLAGWQLPVQRAGIMGLVVLGALMISRGNDVISSLFFAFFVLLVLNPNHLYSVSFQLSFLSVIFIMGFVPSFSEWFQAGKSQKAGPAFTGWEKILRSIKILFSTTLAATLGTWPLVLYYFHVVSFTSLIANFLIVPLTSLALFASIFVLAVSCVSFPLAQILIHAPVAMILASINIVHWLANFSLGYLYLPSPHLLAVALYYLFLIIILLGLYKILHYRIKIIFAVGLAGTVISLFIPLFQSRNEVTILHVPGSSVVFSEDRAGRKILFNGGKGESAEQDYWTVIPFLKSKGVKDLDAVFTTSVKKKYWGGLMRISDHCAIESLIVPWPHARDREFQRLLSKIKKKKGRLSGLVPGEKHFFSNMTQVNVIPLYKAKMDNISKKLESSAVSLRHGNMQILMLDESFSPENWNRLKNEPADILYVNGRKFGQNENIASIFNLKPRVVILANFPAEEDDFLREHIEKTGGFLYNLKETGAIIIKPVSDGFEIRTFQPLKP